MIVLYQAMTLVLHRNTTTLIIKTWATDSFISVNILKLQHRYLAHRIVHIDLIYSTL